MSLMVVGAIVRCSDGAQRFKACAALGHFDVQPTGSDVVRYVVSLLVKWSRHL
jgi:hypothetical protein